MRESLTNGANVEHHTRPEWGPGRILHITNNKPHITLTHIQHTPDNA
jgi:hypothetical protein